MADRGDPATSAPCGIEVWHTHPGRRLSSSRIAHLTACVLMGEGVEWEYVGVVLSRRDEIHRMNREYLAHDYPTDVLSFVMSREGGALEGEVYVDLDMAATRAPDFKTTFTEEAVRYVIHGLLHLCGHDDATDELRQGMRRLENRYLAACWE